MNVLGENSPKMFNVLEEVISILISFNKYSQHILPRFKDQIYPKTLSTFATHPPIHPPARLPLAHPLPYAKLNSEIHETR
jgi:hypothetical protein